MVVDDTVGIVLVVVVAVVVIVVVNTGVAAEVFFLWDYLSSVEYCRGGM